MRTILALLFLAVISCSGGETPPSSHDMDAALSSVDGSLDIILNDGNDTTLDQPIVSHDTTLDQPIVSHDTTRDQPIVSHDTTVDQPIVSHDATVDQPVIPHDTSADTLSPTPEVCDDVDNNLNGQIDENTYVPSAWDAATYLPAGYWNLPIPTLAVIQGSYLYSANPATNKKLLVLKISDINKLHPTMGITLPASGYTAMTSAPAGFWGLKQDFLILARDVDKTFYVLWIDASKKLKGAKYLYSDLFKTDTPATVDAMVAVSAKYFGTDGLAVITGQVLRFVTPPLTVTKFTNIKDVLYPAQSTGAYPTGLTIQDAFSIPSQYGIALVAGNKIYYVIKRVSATKIEWAPTTISTVNLIKCF